MSIAERLQLFKLNLTTTFIWHFFYKCHDREYRLYLKQLIFIYGYSWREVRAEETGDKSEGLGFKTNGVIDVHNLENEDDEEVRLLLSC